MKEERRLAEIRAELLELESYGDAIDPVELERLTGRLEAEKARLENKIRVDELARVI